MAKFLALLIYVSLISFIITPVYAQTYTRIPTGTPSTPLSVTSGSIANINDDDTGTSVSVAGVTTTTFFFLLDFGSDVNFDKISAVLLDQGSLSDSGWALRYSSSPLTSSNLGTTCGTTFTVTATPTTFDRVCSGSARYFGIERAGNWNGSTISIKDFNVYLEDVATPTPSPTSNPTPDLSGGVFFDATTSASIHDAIYVNWWFYSIIVFIGGIWVSSIVFKR